jgi:hypothetical protein
MRHQEGTILLLFAIPACSFAASDDDLLQAARNGHRQGREAIGSIHVRMRIESTVYEAHTSQTSTISGEWLQSGSSIRSTEFEDSQGRPRQGATRADLDRSVRKRTTLERSLIGGLSVQLETYREDDGPARQSADIGTDRGASFFDPWSRAAFTVQDRPPLFLSNLLDEPGSVKKIDKCVESGDPCIHVLLQGANKLAVETWLSLNHGFLAKRLIVGRGEIKPSGFYGERLVGRFRDCGQGVFFPEECTMKVHLAGKPVDEMAEVTITHFDIVSINKPIPPERLRLSIPEGTPTVDRRTKTAYRMGRDGKPAPDSPIIALPDFVAPVRAEALRAPPWLTGILIGAVVGCAALAVWGLYRRFYPESKRTRVPLS